LPEDGALQGIQAAVWTEFIPDRRTLHYYLFPRLLAVAEIAWSGAGVTSWEEFEPRLRSAVAWLESQGVLPRPWDECTEDGQARIADVPAAVLNRGGRARRRRRTKSPRPGSLRRADIPPS